MPDTMSEMTGPDFGHCDIDAVDCDLIGNHARIGDPLGARMFVHGRVLDGNGRPVAHMMVDIWLAARR
jgi:protocatechuate 3,4-dioxygenase, beta subunit